MKDNNQIGLAIHQIQCFIFKSVPWQNTYKQFMNGRLTESDKNELVQYFKMHFEQQIVL